MSSIPVIVYSLVVRSRIVVRWGIVRTRKQLDTTGTINSYRLKLLRLAPAKFIHFGTTREILALMSDGVENYQALSWGKQVNSSISSNCAGYNSVLSHRASIGENCYLEVSFVHDEAKVGNNVLLSYIDIHDEMIPDDVVLHGLKQKNGKFVCRIYGVQDNPKENKLFGKELSQIQKNLGLSESDLWDSDNYTLWTANLYPEADSIRQAVQAALNVYYLVHETGDLEEWKKSNRKSLCSGFHDADSEAIIAWNRRMQELVKMDEIAAKIYSRQPAKDTSSLQELTKIQQSWLEKKLSCADFSETMRLQYYIGTALQGKEGNAYIADCFHTISNTILHAAMEGLQYNDTCKISKDKHVVTNVPKGSGLGTSSILSAACVKAIFEFMGIEHTEADLYAHVLAMEQIMSTGGGWQDQVGGVVNGIKYITSKPGLNQELKVEHIQISESTKKELDERFCLIYTGQRRLARNLLRDVVGRYVGNEPGSLFALNEIQRVAALMRFELERGNVDAFAELLEYHWSLSKKVDIGSTNTLIEQIFAAIDHLIDARMVCGAGGGGFLQVILKKGVSKQDVHKRLKEVFQDNPVDVWDCQLI